MDDLLRAEGDPAEDLLKAAGVDPMDNNPRRGKTRKTTGGRGQQKATREEESYGGHNLRQVVGSRARGGEQIRYRPRSKLATADAMNTMESLLQPATPRQSASTRKSRVDFEDDEDDGDDEESGEYEDDEGSGDDDEENEDEDDGGEKMQPQLKSNAQSHPPPPWRPHKHQHLSHSPSRKYKRIRN